MVPDEVNRVRWAARDIDGPDPEGVPDALGVGGIGLGGLDVPEGRAAADTDDGGGLRGNFLADLLGGFALAADPEVLAVHPLGDSALDDEYVLPSKSAMAFLRFSSACLPEAAITTSWYSREMVSRRISSTFG